LQWKKLAKRDKYSGRANVYFPKTLDLFMK
jgi:hypothetical protein